MKYLSFVFLVLLANSAHSQSIDMPMRDWEFESRIARDNENFRKSRIESESKAQYGWIVSQLTEEIAKLREEVASLRKELAVARKPKAQYRFPKSVDKCMHTGRIVMCGVGDGGPTWYECDECGKRWDKKPSLPEWPKLNQKE